MKDIKKEYKTLSVSKETYMIIKSKQEELMRKNNGDYVEMSYITESAILEGIDKVTI